MQMTIVVAASENNVIGVDNELPCHLPNDLKFFKQKTLGRPIIMGKNTWLSLGKPLPGRLNIILSSSMKDAPEGTMLFSSFNDAIDFLKQELTAEACIIGGGQIYKALLPQTDVVYLTRVHTVIENGTAFFPELNADEWQLEWSEAHSADEKHLFDFTFQKWIRKA